MLQQTQVSRVRDYYVRMIERFPTVYDLAKVSWEEFLPYYAGLGYYRRGRNMVATAQKIVSEFGGEFPRTEKELLTLPGVGPYTARAILSFAYGEDALAFDTNHQRVFGRYLHGNKKSSLDPQEMSNQLFQLPILNGAIMDFANAVCTKKPQCATCPLASQCVYFATGGTEEENTASQKTTFPLKEAQAVIFLHENHKVYFAQENETNTFEPFVLPALQNSRAKIKHFFLQKYQLEVAVRPPFAKGFLDEQPTIYINAQILTGKHSFASFSPQDAQSWRNSADLQEIA